MPMELVWKSSAKSNKKLAKINMWCCSYLGCPSFWPVLCLFWPAFVCIFILTHKFWKAHTIFLWTWSPYLSQKSLVCFSSLLDYVCRKRALCKVHFIAPFSSRTTLWHTLVMHGTFSTLTLPTMMMYGGITLFKNTQKVSFYNIFDRSELSYFYYLQNLFCPF